MAMKPRDVLVCVLTMVSSVLCDNAVEECSGPRASSGRVSLISRRNATGHWTAQVRLEHGDSLGPWEVDVEHSTAKCGDMESVNIEMNVTAPTSRVATGYDFYPGMGHYKLYTDGRTWKEALKTCTQDGAHLAIINSESESNILKNLMSLHPKIPNVSDQNHVFLGYHDLYKEGEFVTVLGQSLNNTGFSRWSDSSQPNNSNAGPDADSDCGGMNRNGGLNDLPCGWKLAFFCEQGM